MVRLNIIIPEDVGRDLKRVKNKSRFIAQTLRDRFKQEKKRFGKVAC